MQITSSSLAPSLCQPNSLLAHCHLRLLISRAASQAAAILQTLNEWDCNVIAQPGFYGANRTHAYCPTRAAASVSPKHHRLLVTWLLHIPIPKCRASPPLRSAYFLFLYLLSDHCCLFFLNKIWVTSCPFHRKMNHNEESKEKHTKKRRPPNNNLMCRFINSTAQISTSNRKFVYNRVGEKMKPNERFGKREAI